MSAFVNLLAIWTLVVGFSLQVGGQVPAHSQPQPGGEITVKLETQPSKAPGSSFLETLKAFAELAGVLAWPSVLGIFVITQRKVLGRLFESVIEVVRFSTRIKLGDMIDVEVDRSAKQAEQQQTPTREIPPVEVEAAGRVSRLVGQLDLPGLRTRMLAFAREYEATRSSMPPGPERTRAMNAIVAKMRTLAMACRPLVKEFTSSVDSPGIRLAGISILQLSPDLEYLDWLVQRMGTEQPFVLFHASIAILAAVRGYGSTHRDVLKAAVERALEKVRAFTPGPPDRNTVETLTRALSELGN